MSMCAVTGVSDVTFLPGSVQWLSVQERSSSSLSVEQFVLHTAVHNPKLRLTTTKTTCQSTSYLIAPQPLTSDPRPLTPDLQLTGKLPAC